ncbi:pyroglutamyl-peptidase I (macronuclear) [Tetrahymena thermophila SB210]|uniref:Pyroglutamyl-peptidase I n=1 Tax=Tetrahymena thermophila (strain SB210) TaxID=312017 RepID=I7MN45_TETTS|nr:pyroglutamyl-peptidase I [Tetrahymena thermophila SB210]EAS07893.1 pyroglutamyl-peptidase I [Tetrahymena thermophila SB210]|eukprot:XP_001028135.1 pyroglutamyl-peptidase I [Tetrahymena thermophila SB210]
MQQQQQQKDIYFFLTGFGEFYGVKDNPTKTLIESLKNEEKEQLSVLHAEVLEVSIQGVDEYINQIGDNIQKRNDNNSIYVLLHFGVDANSKNFVLEQTGYNQKHFICPDMRNNTPCQQLISKDFNIDHGLKTNLDLEEVKNLILSESIKVTANKDVFKLGNDPGRYICNYIYFRSLHCFQHQIQNTGSQIYSLFIHCPPFKEINQETQKDLVFILIKSIQKSLLNEKQQ